MSLQDKLVCANCASKCKLNISNIFFKYPQRWNLHSQANENVKLSLFDRNRRIHVKCMGTSKKEVDKLPQKINTKNIESINNTIRIIVMFEICF